MGAPTAAAETTQRGGLSLPAAIVLIVDSMANISALDIAGPETPPSPLILMSSQGYGSARGRRRRP